MAFNVHIAVYSTLGKSSNPNYARKRTLPSSFLAWHIATIEKMNNSIERFTECQSKVATAKIR